MKTNTSSANGQVLSNNGRRVNRGLKPQTSTYTHSSWIAEDDLDETGVEDAEDPSFSELLEEPEQDDGSGAVCTESLDANLDEETRKSILQSLSKSERLCTVVHRWVVALTGHFDDAAVLERIIFWTGPGRGRGHKPSVGRGLLKPWTARTSKQFAREIGLSPDTVTRCLRRLKAQRFIGWRTRKFAGIPQRHFWVNWKTIAECRAANVNEIEDSPDGDYLDDSVPIKYSSDHYVDDDYDLNEPDDDWAL